MTPAGSPFAVRLADRSRPRRLPDLRQLAPWPPVRPRQKRRTRGRQGASTARPEQAARRPGFGGRRRYLHHAGPRECARAPGFACARAGPECAVPRMTPAGNTAPPGKIEPAPRRPPPWRCPAWPPVMRLANGAWPSSPRQAACRATPCPAEPRQRLAPLAFSPLLPPALPSPPSLRHCAPHGRPSGACGSPLATVCPSGPPAPLRAPAPARPGCRAAPARTALLVFGSPACHPSAPPEVAPQKSALARRRTVDKSAFFALVAP
jgi:hypothetical protein